MESNISKFVKTQRKARGLTQKQLAFYAGESEIDFQVYFKNTPTDYLKQKTF